MIQVSLAILWLGIIYVLSAQPDSAAFTAQLFGDSNYTIRKLAHVTEFGILTYIFYRILPRAARRSVMGIIFVAILATICAGLDEFHQTFVPDRTGCIEDVLFDMIGIVIASALLITNRKSVRQVKPRLVIGIR